MKMSVTKIAHLIDSLYRKILNAILNFHIRHFDLLKNVIKKFGRNTKFYFKLKYSYHPT